MTWFSNKTPLMGRFQAFVLARRVRVVSRRWDRATKRMPYRTPPPNGQLARALGAFDIHTEPSSRQMLLLLGTEDATARIAHIVQAFEGAARLLSFRAGDPLPWSSMVLARTAFEGSLRLLSVLEPVLADELRLARIAASALESIREAEKLANVVRLDEVEGIHEELRAIDARGRASLHERKRMILHQCIESGLQVTSHRGGGRIITADGSSAVYPFNAVETAKAFWHPQGTHMYRWLSNFTHANPSAYPTANVDVAALSTGDVVAVFMVLSEAVWLAMDRFSKWVGFKNGATWRAMRQVRRMCTGGGRTGRRPPGPGEAEILQMLDTAKAAGLLSPRAHRIQVIQWTHRIDDW